MGIVINIMNNVPNNLAKLNGNFNSPLSFYVIIFLGDENGTSRK